MEPYGTRSEESSLQTGNPIQVAFSPDFFEMFRSTMREEIVAYCEEGGFRSPTSLSISGRDPESHIPGPPKRPRDDPVRRGGDYLDSDREDGEFLSDEEEIEFQLPALTARFFKADYYIYLLSKTISALDLVGASGGKS